MGKWRQVYRSATKRVLRRKGSPASHSPTPKRIPPGGESAEGVPTHLVLGGLFFFCGVLSGGFTGFVLMGVGALIFFSGE